MAAETRPKRPIRWHIGIFLAPAVLVYTAIMILPLAGTLQLSLFRNIEQHQIFVGLENFRWVSGTRSGTTPGSLSSTCWCRTRSASCWPHFCPARG
jgi:ABC-type sugar transport system permease subunit